MAAHEAGNEADAQAFANAIREMRASEAPAKAPAAPREEAQLSAYEPGMLERLKNAVNDSDLRRHLIGPSRNQLLQQGTDRMVAGDELRPQSIDERGALPSMLATIRKPAGIATRILPAMLASTGGPTGAAINAAGEAVGQMVDPRAQMAPNRILEGSNGPSSGPDIGRIVQAGAVGAVPLGSGSGIMNTAWNAAKMGGAGYVGEQARSMIDEGKPSDNAGTQAGIMAAISAATGLSASAIEAVRRMIGKSPAIANTVKAITQAAGQKEGYVIPPYEANPSMTNKVLGGIAGKAATGQQASLNNQEVTTKLAGRALGIPEGTEITPAVLNAVRHEAAAPYREIASLSHAADKDLEALKQARFEANAQHKFYQRSADPSALKAAKQAETTVDALETSIEQHAVQAGRPELVPALKAARTTIAKTYNVENALNLGDAQVSAPTLGRQLDRGAPLSGELETIAKFQQTFPKNMVEGASVPAPGVSKIGAGLGTLLGTSVGIGTHNPALGVLAAIAPEVASQSVRKFMLSQPGQRLMNTPMNANTETAQAIAKVLAQLQAKKQADTKNKD